MKPDTTPAARPQTLDEAQAFIAATYRCTLPVEILGLDDAEGQVLADDLSAPCDLPRFPASAMDGYAVRDADFRDGQPTMLRIAGTARAGHPFARRLEPGQAVRIYTGAMVPEGADRVIMQEDCRVGSGTIVTDLIGKRKPHIRLPGEDVRRGQMLLPRGTRLTPAQLALLSALQVPAVKVRRWLKVTLISTGDELRPPGDELAPGQIVDSNGPYLRRMLEQLNCEVEFRGIIADRADLLLAALIDAAQESDLIITSGGASVGAEDHLRPLIAKRGFLEFWRLRMKPGKPVGLGDIDDCPILVLPGNPVAAAVSFKVIGQVLIAALAGDRQVMPRRLRLPLAASLQKTTDRLEILAARLTANVHGDAAVEVLRVQGSASLLALASAEGWAVIPPGTDLEAGDQIDYLI